MVSAAGRWIGRIDGTNQGSFLFAVQQTDTKLSGELNLNDSKYGIAVFDALGTIEADAITFLLTPRATSPGVEIKTATVRGIVEDDGTFRGQWETEGGTLGTFVAIQEDTSRQNLKATAVPSNPAVTATLFEKSTRLPASVVDYDMLRRVYRDLKIGAEEASRLAIATAQASPASGRPPHSPENIRLLNSVSIVARGTSGEQVVTIDPDVLNRELLPKPLLFITFEIGLYHRLMLNGGEAPNRVLVNFDFSKPAIFDLSNPSGSPTPNNSSIKVTGTDSIWVSGVYEKVLSTVREGKATSWLHLSHVYDVLFAVLGLPVALASAAVLSEWIAGSLTGKTAYKIGVFAFALYAALMIFRLAFSFTRWLLPYIEFAPMPQPRYRRLRAIFATMILGILGSLGAAAIWQAFHPA
jgi:hypothetical protein